MGGGGARCGPPNWQSVLPDWKPVLPAPARLREATQEYNNMQDEKLVGQLARIADALEELVRAAKEKENIPPTPPIREKEVSLNKPRARVRE